MLYYFMNEERLLQSLINRFWGKMFLYIIIIHRALTRPAQNASSAVIQRSIITEPYNYVFHRSSGLMSVPDVTAPNSVHPELSPVIVLVLPIRAFLAEKISPQKGAYALTLVITG